MHHFGALKRFADLEFTILAVITGLSDSQKNRSADEFRLVMDWDDYKYFSALAATRSVRAAAEQLEVNPSTVSRRLEHFEERLGVQLFTRSRRGLDDYSGRCRGHCPSE